ncbi:tripartite motif-containing protein 16 [Tachyglossus aculeatus]|uniref:tripartite motif-containing protein 16 n=1 Tax=Tachyglossus aculeatus TaxID=9261 RepID=UPI0018F72005|nr:tripartite motif-containing protein 16 [Tachyglossus aculeatus]
MADVATDLWVGPGPQAPIPPGLDGPAQREGPGPPASRGEVEAGPQGAEEEVGALGDEGEVLCDFCLEDRVKAVKSCLVCMVNYCQEHLRPHQLNSKLHDHALAEPTKDRAVRACATHHAQLTHFCRLDQQCICEECRREDHLGHPADPLERARKEKEDELRRTQLDFDRRISTAENAIGRLQANTKSIVNSVSEVKAAAEEQFGELMGAVRKAQSEVLEFLEGKERAAVSHANGIRTHLENQCAQMGQSQRQLEGLAGLTNPVLFLEEYCKFKKSVEDSPVPSVYIGLKDKLSGIRTVITDSTALLVQQLQDYKGKLQEFAKEEEYEISTQVSAYVPRKYWVSYPEPVSRQEFLKYAHSISLDPDTAHRYLRLLEENRRVTNTTPWEHAYPDHPDRFEHWRQVLAKQSLYLHRYYFEVEVSGAGTYVGVTYRSIDRKGTESNGCISGNNFSWSLHWGGREFSAWHSDAELPLQAGPFPRLGVYLNYPGETLSFYGVSADAMTLLHRFACKFAEPVFPAFWLSKKDNSVRIVELTGDGQDSVASAPPDQLG